MSKLVVINADPMEHLLIKHLLKHCSAFSQVTYVLDGSFIIEFIEEYSLNESILPDVILLDLAMPYLSSWDFLDRLHRIYDNVKKKIDVYLLTPFIHHNDVERLSKYPFVKSVISKPLNTEILNNLTLYAASCP